MVHFDPVFNSTKFDVAVVMFSLVCPVQRDFVVAKMGSAIADTIERKESTTVLSLEIKGRQYWIAPHAENRRCLLCDDDLSWTGRSPRS